VSTVGSLRTQGTITCLGDVTAQGDMTAEGAIVGDRANINTDVIAGGDANVVGDVNAASDVNAFRGIFGDPSGLPLGDPNLRGVFAVVATATKNPHGQGVRGEGSFIGVVGTTREHGSNGVLGVAFDSTAAAVEGSNVKDSPRQEPGPGFGGRFRGAGWLENPIPPYGKRGGLLVRGHFFTQGGFKSAVVPHPDGSHRLLHSIESPESWFEDFGRAQITGGRAWVDLDPDFAAVVDTEDYHVFLTPEGDSNGLYVSRSETEGFEVREQQDGTSGLTLSYRVVARRKEASETGRLAKVELPEETPITLSEEDFEQRMRVEPPTEPTQPEKEAES
jgi:hypothetical protein